MINLWLDFIDKRTRRRFLSINFVDFVYEKQGLSEQGYAIMRGWA